MNGCRLRHQRGAPSEVSACDRPELAAGEAGEAGIAATLVELVQGAARAARDVKALSNHLVLSARANIEFYLGAREGGGGLGFFFKASPPPPS